MLGGGDSDDSDDDNDDKMFGKEVVDDADYCAHRTPTRQMSDDADVS